MRLSLSRNLGQFPFGQTCSLFNSLGVCLVGFVLFHLSDSKSQLICESVSLLRSCPQQSISLFLANQSESVATRELFAYQIPVRLWRAFPLTFAASTL